MAHKVTSYEMVLKGSALRVEEDGYVTIWNDLDDTPEEVIQISNMRDARFLESLCDVSGVQYSFRLTQGEIRDFVSKSGEEAWKIGQSGRFG